MRATELLFNKRIWLPGPIKEESEIIMYQLKLRLKQVTTNYVSTKQRNFTNLSKKEINWLNSLKKKVKDQEIIIFQTDKSGHLSVDTPSNHREASLPQVKDYSTTTYEQHGELESIVNAHAIFWTRVLEAGKETGSGVRIKNNMANANSPIAPLYTLRKDHTRYDDSVK